MLEKEYYMKEALKEAKKAYKKQEIPVGAIIVKDGNIIARGYNQKELKKDSTMHAEIIAIRKASKKIGAWRLNDCEMYITLEPCPMCAGAIVQSRIKKIYIGTESNIKSNKKIVESILQNNEFDHRVEVEYLNNKECSQSFLVISVNNL